jgi:hypothetical protein
MRSKISDTIHARYGEYVDTVDDLSNLSDAFFIDPGSISFSMTPDEPLTHKMAESFGNDRSGFYNAFKMVFKVNDLDPVPVIFNENFNLPETAEAAPEAVEAVETVEEVSVETEDAGTDPGETDDASDEEAEESDDSE